jgi:NAD-dependent dihydropyrimidine dehydrogenase PreA subunit
VDLPQGPLWLDPSRVQGLTFYENLMMEDRMSDSVFLALREQLDRYSMGFPSTDSGIELKILKYLFSEDDAAMFLALTPRLETPTSVASRLGKPEEEVASQLYDMSQRGLLFRLDRSGEVKYGAIPFVHGLFEFQVKNLEPEMAEMVYKYFDEAFDTAMQDGAEYFLRTIPVQKSVEVTHNVAAFDDAVAILREKDLIVITECICRKSRKMVADSCDKPMEACFMFGSMGQYYLDRGMGRKIDVEEATDILSKCRDAGLVTQPATSQNPGGMCNCCGDCCGVLRALRKHPKPAEKIISNYYVTVDSEECTGCEACLDRCQMDALSMTEEDVVEVDRDRCIGCGLCVTDCPSEALRLSPKNEDNLRVPPKSTMDQMMSMAQKRGLF